MPFADDLSSLFELLPIGAYRVDAANRRLRANAAMVRLFGLSSEAELLALMQSEDHSAYVQPGRRAEFRQQLEQQGAVRDFVSEMRRQGTGERFWISENAQLVRDDAGRVLHIEGTVEDVTQRMQALDALQLTLDNAGRGIARMAADGTVVLYNREALELLDLPEELMASRPKMSDVIRLQEERGDFGGEQLELLDESAREALAADHGSTAAAVLSGLRRYLRRTRTGRVIEVTSQPLPDGGMVRTYSDVTAYMTAQQALAEKTRALQITLDSMSQGIATIDATGRCIMSNRRHQELLGFSEALMATQPTMEELVRFQIERGDFGDNFSFVDAVARGYVAVGDKLPPIEGPETYLRKTRDGRTIEVRTRPLPDGGVVRTFTDMTAYAQAQEALARQEAQLRALVSNIPDRVWLKDADGVYRLSNTAHWRHYGLSEDAIVGRTADQLFGAEEGARQRATDQQAMALHEPLAYEDRIMSLALGQWQHVEIVKVAMRDEQGRCTGLLGIARDITARKEAESALIAAKNAAEAGERAKSEFLANMSHEIRTPMNAVIGMSDLLLTTPLTPAQREFAETIRTSGDQLLGLINDILDFSKIESGHLALEQVPVDLQACVDSALDLAGAAAAAKGLDLLAWVDDAVPRSVFGDATRLRQVLVNLLTNAVKFTRRGAVVLRVELRPGGDGQPWLHVSVRDTGIGIPADRMDRLFQVFSQVDASTTRQFGGTGLGLAICRRLVTLMGGRIWAESREGEGSAFQFELPCLPVPAWPASEQAPPVPALPPGRVLIVAGQADSREVLALHARRWGLAPQAAATAAEALAWLDAGQRFDAAVLDAQLDGIDGYALAAELRRRGEAWPLVMLTAPGPAVPRPGMGITQSLPKPVKPRTLHDALAAALAPPQAVVSAPAPLTADDAPRLAQQVPLRLLLAEDNLMNQRVASLLLGRLGYEVVIVGDGQSALEAQAQARAAGQPFDVVLLDVQMPGLDGLATARRLRDLPADERPYMVAMTANAMQGDREACLAAGMDDYLAKPIRASALADALRQAGAVLAQRTGARALNPFRRQP